MMDLTPVGTVSAELMGVLEDDVDLPEGAVVEEVMVIAAVTWPAKEGMLGNAVYYRSTSSRPWTLEGLLAKAIEAVGNSGRAYDPFGDAPDDDEVE